MVPVGVPRLAAASVSAGLTSGVGMAGQMGMVVNWGVCAGGSLLSSHCLCSTVQSDPCFPSKARRNPVGFVLMEAYEVLHVTNLWGQCEPPE